MKVKSLSSMESQVPAMLEELMTTLGGKDAPLATKDVKISANLAHGMLALLTQMDIKNREKTQYLSGYSYSQKVQEEDRYDLIPVEEFIQGCNDEAFLDYDGFGYPVKDGFYMPLEILPSNVKDILPTDATNILWFNK